MGFLLKDKDIKAFLQGFALLMIFMILLSSVVMVIQFAHADGASTTEEVWIEWKSGWSGEDSIGGGAADFEGKTWASKYNYSSWDFDIINITDVRVHVDNDDSVNTRTYRVGFWDYVSDVDADARFGYIEFTALDTVNAAWKTGSTSTPITITSADPTFFMGAWAESMSDSAKMGWGTEGEDATVYNYTSFPDTFEEEGTTPNTALMQFKAWGYKNTTTTHNQYYGNSTHYTARRDLNATFPTGSVSRQIRITYPNDETIVNITRSNGGLFDTALSSDDYTDEALNATHNLMTIPDATIALYGGDYRTYTQSAAYLYTFYGLYYENGTSAGSTDVTVYLSNGATETINVTGTYVYASATEVDEISWEAGQDARPIAFYQNSGTYYLFTPEDTYGVYQFDINDYSGRVGQGESYLESYRAVNGTWRLVERRQFTGIYNDVPLLMVVYEIYKVQIRFSDGSIYDHGYFYPGVDLAPTIAVTTIAFSDQAHTVYQYITAEATRPNATHIQLEYTDETPGYDTTAANMTISYRNGSQAYSTVVAGADTITFNWYSANNVTDYVVYLYLTHQLHGSIQQTWILDYSRIFESFPDFGLFGDMGGLPTSNLLAIGVGLVVAGACSFKSAALAPFLFMCIQAIFTYLGGASYTDTQIGIGIALSIMLGLAIGDRQI